MLTWYLNNQTDAERYPIPMFIELKKHKLSVLQFNWQTVGCGTNCLWAHWGWQRDCCAHIEKKKALHPWIWYPYFIQKLDMNNLSAKALSAGYIVWLRNCEGLRSLSQATISNRTLAKGQSNKHIYGLIQLMTYKVFRQAITRP